MKIKVYKNKNLVRGINVALKNELYIDGWNLKKYLEKEKVTKSKDSSLSIVYVNKKAVAVSLYSENLIQAYCRDDKRKRGYATKAVKALGLESPPYLEGIFGSMLFWEKIYG